MGTLEPIAVSPRDAARFLSISKRTMSRLISSRKIAARKDGKRTLVDVASLKAYYASLPLKTDSVPLVFVHPVTRRRIRRSSASVSRTSAVTRIS
jgi:excisionase family DNA binding protein